jgi:winged helix DNA-binding protein
VADLVGAVQEARSLVLTWTMRGTRHLHPATDVGWLLAVFGPVFGRPGRRAAELGLAGEAGDRAQEAIRRALEGGGDAVEVAPFVPPGRRLLRDLEAEAAAVGAFLGTQPRLDVVGTLGTVG